MLIRQYSSTVYFHCLSYLKSSDRAEELTQDIFLQIWRRQTKLKDIHSFKDYLFIVSRNMIYKSFRKKIREMANLTGQDDLVASDQADLQMDYKESYGILLKGICLLPEKRRQAFALSRFEGKTHEEIAGIMNIGKITVAQYIMFAVDFLKRYLKKNTEGAVLLCMLFWS